MLKNNRRRRCIENVLSVCIRDARRRSSARRDVQLSITRRVGATGSPAAKHSKNRGRGSGGVVSVIRPDVFGDRPAVDSAGEVVASAVAADVVLDTK